MTTVADTNFMLKTGIKAHIIYTSTSHKTALKLNCYTLISFFNLYFCKRLCQNQI